MNMRQTVILMVVLLLVPTGAFAASGSSLANWYVIPAAAHAEGDKGTYWRTDVSVVNPYGWQAITVKIKYLKSGENNSTAVARSFTIGANHQLLLEDIVFETFGSSGSGALVLETDDGSYFSVSARTYTGDTATFGQTENGQKAVCHSDDNALISGIRNDARYRTNIGAVNAGSSPTTLRARVYDGNGLLVGTQKFDLLPWSHQQVSVGSFAGTVDSGYVRWDCLSTSSTRWVAYASVVDNVSGDAVFLEEREDAQYTQYNSTYDLDGWWYGTFSGPAGSGSLYVLIYQTGPMLTAYTFTLDGYVEVFLGGFANGSQLTIEAGYGFTIPCWNDWVTGGHATATASSISGSYTAAGDCFEGTTTFSLARTSAPRFAESVEDILSTTEDRHAMSLGIPRER